MDLRQGTHEGLAHLEIRGGVEAYEAAMLSDAIREEIEERGGTILLEFDGTSTVSSVTIGLLIQLQKLATAYGGEIVLVRPPKLLTKSLRLLAVDSILRWVETVEAGARLSRHAA